MGGDIWLRGGLANGIKKYLRQFSISFEHEQGLVEVVEVSYLFITRSAS